MRCCLPGCLNDANKGSESDGITFHRFPKELHLRNLWKEALDIVDWAPKEWSVLCSQHFQQDAFYETKSGVRRVRKDAVPVSDIEIFSTLQMEQVKQEAKEEGMLFNNKNIKIKQELLDDDEMAESSKTNSTTAQPNDNINTNLKIKGETEYMLQVTQIKQELPIEYVTVDSSEPIPNVTEVHDVSGYLMEMQENDSKQSLVTSECKEEQPDEANFGSSTEYESGPKLSTEQKFGEYGTSNLHQQTIKREFNEEQTETLDDDAITEGSKSKYRDATVNGTEDSSLKGSTVSVIQKQKYILKESLFKTECIEEQPEKASLKQNTRTKTVAADKRFTCEFCDYRCRFRSGLLYHIKKHKTEKKWACPICGSKFKTKGTLSTHIKVHTSKKPFSCNICNYTCDRKSWFTVHILTHTGEKPFACDMCDYRSILKSNLTNHIMTHTGEKPFSCNMCNYRSILKSNLTKHIKTHTGEKPFSCDLCNYRCFNNLLFNRHIMITHSRLKPFSCQTCEYRCNRKKALLVHNVNTHGKEKPFPCDICDYWCISKSRLTEHMRIHTGEKPFSCDMCAYRCTQKSGLTTHMKTHTGEKPFSCDMCDFRSIQKPCLTKHIKTHTGEKPFSCDMCDYRSIQKSSLTQHLRTHSAEKLFSCNMCDNKGIHKSNLIKHKDSHGEKANFVCYVRL